MPRMRCLIGCVDPQSKQGYEMMKGALLPMFLLDPLILSAEGTY